MSTAIQRRRGTTAQHAAFTGLTGETTVDTDKNVVVVHNGATAGGFPLLRENGSQNLVTTGTVTGASLSPTSSTVPTNGIYLFAANSVAISTGGSGRLFIDSSGRIGVAGAPSASTNTYLQVGYAGIGSDHVLYNYDSYFANNLYKTGNSLWNRISARAGGLLRIEDDVFTYSTANSGTAGASATLSERFRITSTGALNFVGAGTAGSTQAVSFNGSAPVNSLVIDSSGRLGVGTSSPVSGAQLTVAGSALAVTGQNLDHSANSIRIGEEGSGAAQIRCYGPNTSTNGSLTFKMSRSDGTNSQDVVIDGSGRLGIGSSTPAAPLEVVGASGSNIGVFRTNDATAANNAGGGFYGVASATAGSRRAQFFLDADGANFGGNDYFYISKNGNSGVVEIIQQSNAAMGFHTNGARAVTIDSSQRVGIGVTSPDCSLHVQGTTDGIYARLKNTAGTSSRIAFESTGVASASIGIPSGSSALAFYLASESTERMRIDSSGRLLVGTSSTNSFFNSAVQIAGNNVAGTQLISRFDNGSGGPVLYFAKSRSATVGTNTIVQSGDELGGISWYGADGSNYVPAAQIRADVDGTPGASDMPARLVFSTTADGASSPTERMRINSASRTRFSGTRDLAIDCETSGSVSIFGLNPGGAGGALRLGCNTKTTDPTSGVSLNENATSFGTFSDERIKTDLAPIDNGLDKVGTLRAVTGRYIHDDEGVSRSFLIAQDVQQVLPEAVYAEVDEMQTLNLRYTEVIPLLVAALKESKERIEALEAKVAALEAQ